MALVIKDSVIVTGSKLLTNEDIADLYTGDSSKEDAIKFLGGIGRNTRFVSVDDSETTEALGIEVAKRILKKNNLTGKDIDAIVFCCQFPEYTMPCQALLVHKEIDGKDSPVAFDLNANCLGMLRGLDVLNRYFNDKDGDIHRALLIGADYASKHMKTDDLVTLGSFADGGCALLLEYSAEEGKGVIGSATRTSTEDVYDCLFPECGLSKIDIHSNTKTYWTNPNTKPSIIGIKDALDEVLTKHNLKAEDIDWFCGSQFAKPYFDSLGDACAIPIEKRIYVGDRFGYTGTSSPFFAFNQGVEEGKIKSGDVVFFATVGVGFSICSMLVRV